MTLHLLDVTNTISLGLNHGTIIIEQVIREHNGNYTYLQLDHFSREQVSLFDGDYISYNGKLVLYQDVYPENVIHVKYKKTSVEPPEYDEVKFIIDHTNIQYSLAYTDNMYRLSCSTTFLGAKAFNENTIQYIADENSSILDNTVEYYCHLDDNNEITVQFTKQKRVQFSALVRILDTNNSLVVSIYNKSDNIPSIINSDWHWLHIGTFLSEESITGESSLKLTGSNIDVAGIRCDANSTTFPLEMNVNVNNNNNNYFTYDISNESNVTHIITPQTHKTETKKLVTTINLHNSETSEFNPTILSNVDLDIQNQSIYTIDNWNDKIGETKTDANFVHPIHFYHNEMVVIVRNDLKEVIIWKIKRNPPSGFREVKRAQTILYQPGVQVGTTNTTGNGNINYNDVTLMLNSTSIDIQDGVLNVDKADAFTISGTPLNKTHINLENVRNIDYSNPDNIPELPQSTVSNLELDLDAKAPKASPEFMDVIKVSTSAIDGQSTPTRLLSLQLLDFVSGDSHAQQYHGSGVEIAFRNQKEIPEDSFDVTYDMATISGEKDNSDNNIAAGRLVFKVNTDSINSNDEPGFLDKAMCIDSSKTVRMYGGLQFGDEGQVVTSISNSLSNSTTETTLLTTLLTAYAINNTYLPLAGGDIIGNLNVNGTINAKGLNIEGKTFASSVYKRTNITGEVDIYLGRMSIGETTVRFWSEGWNAQKTEHAVFHIQQGSTSSYLNPTIPLNSSSMSLNEIVSYHYKKVENDLKADVYLKYNPHGNTPQDLYWQATTTSRNGWSHDSAHATVPTFDGTIKETLSIKHDSITTSQNLEVYMWSGADLATKPALYVNKNGNSDQSVGIAEFKNLDESEGIGIGYNKIYAAGSDTNQSVNIIPKGNLGVGIGKTDPGSGYMLDVDGIINATGLSLSGEHNITSISNSGNSTGMNTLLTASAINTTYLTQNAASTYLTQTDVSNTYAPKTNPEFTNAIKVSTSATNGQSTPTRMLTLQLLDGSDNNDDPNQEVGSGVEIGFSNQKNSGENTGNSVYYDMATISAEKDRTQDSYAAGRLVFKVNTENTGVIPGLGADDAGSLEEVMRIDSTKQVLIKGSAVISNALITSAEGGYGESINDGFVGFVEGKLLIKKTDTFGWWLGTSTDLNDLWFFTTNLSGETKLVAYLDDSYNAIGLDFTGQHRCQLSKKYDQSLVGLIVECTGKYYNLDKSEIPQINESLPIIQITTTGKSIKIFGVVSEEEDSDTLRSYGGKFKSAYEVQDGIKRTIVNSVGEGGMWVCSEGGNFENGDYITSSNVPGYGMVQSDDLLHNYTVAKITMPCDFDTIETDSRQVKCKPKTEIVQVTKERIVKTSRTETKTKIVEEDGKWVQKTETVTTEEDVYEKVDLYNEEGDIIGKHKVRKMETYTESVEKIVLDENECVVFEHDLDDDENVVYEDKYQIRYLLPDGTVITKAEYDVKVAALETVYKAVFVGCTYHCG